MALIKCKECGKEISDTALMCPYCGIYGEQKEPGAIMLIYSACCLLTLIFLFFAIVYMLYEFISPLF